MLILLLGAVLLFAAAGTVLLIWKKKRKIRRVCRCCGGRMETVRCRRNAQPQAVGGFLHHRTTEVYRMLRCHCCGAEMEL
jgi:hypothetical protein